jgi:hypothetical protein
MDELPGWPQGTVAILAVSGPHAIPVSTAVRLTGDRLAFARIQDHLAGARTEILAAPQWRWTNDEAAEADAKVRAELSRLV